MNAPWEPKTAQGHEMHWVHNFIKSANDQGSNVLGPFLFTKELLPILLTTAKRFPDTTRVIWTSSVAHIFSSNIIINFDNVNLPNRSGWTRYSQSKAVSLPVDVNLMFQANILLATAMAHQYSDQGLLSFSVHPGTVYTVSPFGDNVEV